MTVVHPNHIVGINSITVQTGDSLSIHKNDGSLIRTIVSNTGVSTFHAIEVSKGGGDLTLEDVFNVNSKPIWSAASGSLGTVVENSNANITVAATDPESDTIAYSETTSN